ncbi:hypothetical protein JCM5353_001893 [Sporobolomyces roseus]
MSRSLSSLPSSLPRDIHAFLHSYPTQRSSPSNTANLDFYQGRIAARPSRNKVTQLQDELRGNWQELEHSHSFVQWLFPIREQGVNYQAQPLEVHEITQLKADPEAMERLIESYRIMLAFYGLRLVNPETGELSLEDSTPAPSPSSYLRRFQNLERNSHNFLRITRILKCLNEFGFPQHPPSFLLYILSLQSTHEYLKSSGLVRSMDGYWKWCIRDEEDREFVLDKIEGVRKRGEKWSEEEYSEWVEKRAGDRNVPEESASKGKEEEAKTESEEDRNEEKVHEGKEEREVRN